MKRYCIVFGVGFAFAAVSALWGGVWFVVAPGPLPISKAVVVPKGSVSRVGRELSASRVLASGIASKIGFIVAYRISRAQGQLRAGEFIFPKRASILSVLDTLRFAPAVMHRLTIPEGCTKQEIIAILKASSALSGEVPPFPEGSVLPQTITFPLGETRQKVVTRLQNLMTKTVEAIWQHREPSRAIRSPAELITLASIVERETPKAEDRPLVARVFLNRLDAKMRLQSDATVLYDVSGGLGKLNRHLTHADLASNRGYNTYVIDALPSGPICSPGAAALQAVAHPAVSRALYFVAMDHQNSRFSETLSQHNYWVKQKRSVKPLRNETPQR